MTNTETLIALLDTPALCVAEDYIRNLLIAEVLETMNEEDTF